MGHAVSPEAGIRQLADALQHPAGQSAASRPGCRLACSRWRLMSLGGWETYAIASVEVMPSSAAHPWMCGQSRWPSRRFCSAVRSARPRAYRGWPRRVRGRSGRQGHSGRIVPVMRRWRRRVPASPAGPADPQGRGPAPRLPRTGRARRRARRCGPCARPSARRSARPRRGGLGRRWEGPGPTTGRPGLGPARRSGTGAGRR
jgi:hypothetical protein